MHFAVAQTTRIVGFNIHAVKQQSQLAGVVDAHAQFGIGEVLACCAVVSVAVSNKAICGDGVVDIARLRAVAHGTAGFHAVVPGAETAVVAAGFNCGWLLAFLGAHIDHAAGRVTVQGREGAA